MLIFNGQTIPGSHGPILVNPPESGSARAHFFGVSGEACITSAPAGRDLWTETWIFSRQAPYTKESLRVFLAGLDKLVGTVSDLQIQPPGITTLYRECEFLGFTPSQHGILPDVALTLGGSAWCAGTLRFRQLTVSFD